MKSKKGGFFNFWKKKTLKERLRQRIGEKDICCETNFDRVRIINMIIDNYKEYVSNNYEYPNPNEYLNFITNDLVVFIGYKFDLIKNDKNGAALWDELDKEIGGKNLEVIKKALNELPLSFLLAFLGASVYKKVEKKDEENPENKQEIKQEIKQENKKNVPLK